MEESAKLVSSAYVQVDDSLWIGDPGWDGAQRSRLAKGLVGSMLVVEPLVPAQGMTQVAFVPQQAAVEQLSAA
ncbi:hypothetical protein [Nonomuraea sp. NPDC046570]|uniref:hypothetical protein n=1 Tax=Nonomuraea sp. NPDC046570 TaxID=3155255 RepID=UPI0033ED62FB